MDEASNDESLFLDDNELSSLPPNAHSEEEIQWEDDDVNISRQEETYVDRPNDDDARQLLVVPVKRIPPSPVPATSQLWMLGLPATVLIERKPFNAVESRKEEAEIHKKGDPSALRQLKNSLSTYYIRSCKDEKSGKLRTNTRLVEFSDGSSALIIGRKVFEAGPREEQGVQTLLLEISETPVCHIHGKVTSKKLFSAPHMAEMRALMNSNEEVTEKKSGNNVQTGSALKMKMTTVQHGAESELRLKRHLEEQMARDSESRLTKSAKKKKSAMLNADFLEADD